MLRRGAVCGVLVAGCLASPAAADIYWANEGSNSIGRTDNAAATVDPDFVTGATAPRGVAINGTYIYWAHDGDAGDAPAGNIGRALLDGTTPNQTFLSTAAPPQGLAVDNTRIFWTQPHPTTPGNPGSIGRATLGGLFPNQNFVTTGPAPCGVASNADDLYWGNGGTPGSIGSSHGSFSVVPNFITATSDPCGVAQSEGLLYWTNRAGESIGVANQDGSNPVQNLIDTGASSSPCGVAVAGGRIYWTNRGTDTIGRADLDGGNQDDSFVSGAGVQDPCGIAVTPTAAADPASFAFADTEVGGESEIKSFFVANTSSSVLTFTGASLVGGDTGEFEITGNGCLSSVAPPGLGCIVNARFAPTATGDPSTVLRVTSSASNSPTEVPLTGHANPAPVVEPPPPPPPPPALPGEHARTLSISRAPKSSKFKGTLASESGACATAQKVALLRQKRGTDPRIGSDLTNDAGRWQVGEPGARGRFYAVAKQSELADGALCLAATSETIRRPPD